MCKGEEQKEKTEGTISEFNKFEGKGGGEKGHPLKKEASTVRDLTFFHRKKGANKRPLLRPCGRKYKKRLFSLFLSSSLVSFFLVSF